MKADIEQGAVQYHRFTRWERIKMWLRNVEPANVWWMMRHGRK